MISNSVMNFTYPTDPVDFFSRLSLCVKRACPFFANFDQKNLISNFYFQISTP